MRTRKLKENAILKRLTYTERLAKQELTDQGYDVYKLSWPDFIVLKNGNIEFFVEVKDKGGNISDNQLLSFSILESLGFKIKIWRVIKDKIYKDYKIKDLSNYYKLVTPIFIDENKTVIEDKPKRYIETLEQRKNRIELKQEHKKIINLIKMVTQTTDRAT